MTIPKLILLLGAAFTLQTTNAQKTVYDANAEVRNVGAFTNIEVSSAIDLYLSMGSEDAVVVSAKEKTNTGSIVTEVKNGTLYIAYKGSGISDWGAKNMKAYVSVKTLNKLKASGASDIFAEGIINASDLSIDISGASDFKGVVNSQNLRLKGSGSSDFVISGKATNANIEVSGSSDIKGFGLVTENCDVHATGSSDVNITVNKQLKAEASGSSDINYKGDPTVKDVKSTGASDVNKKG
ncbi:MAG: head GIN domain-containing protein [Chitinophagaceae bacterium]